MEANQKKTMETNAPKTVPVELLFTLFLALGMGAYLAARGYGGYGDAGKNALQNQGWNERERYSVSAGDLFYISDPRTTVFADGEPGVSPLGEECYLPKGSQIRFIKHVTDDFFRGQFKIAQMGEASPDFHQSCTTGNTVLVSVRQFDWLIETRAQQRAIKNMVSADVQK